jgi:hypothetical protein
MKLRLPFWLSAVLAAGVMANSSTFAQAVESTPGSTKDRPSHIPLPSLSGSPELSLEDFQKQLELMGDQVNLEDLLKNVAKNPKDFGLDPNDPDLKNKLDALQGKNGKPPKVDLNDPKTQELLKKLAETYPKHPKAAGGNFNPEDAEKLQKWFDKYQQQHPINGDQKPPDANPGDRNLPDDKKTENNQPSKSPMTLPQPGQKPDGNLSPPSNSPADDKEAKKWYEGTADLLEKFKGSKAVDKAIDSLTGGEDGPEWLKSQNDNEDDDSGWEQFGEKIGFNKLEGWLPKMDGDWMNPKTPSMPSPNLEIKSAPALPNLGGMSESGGVAAAVVLGLILAAVLAFAAWKLRGWFAESDTGTLLGRWRLGPWPVQPALVRTREELVRAFEYLSLLRLGNAARNWNHRQIGDRLGGENSAHTESGEAAARLATVYEHARYAPAADELPVRELEAARRDLCLLAGVAGA